MIEQYFRNVQNYEPIRALPVLVIIKLISKKLVGFLQTV